MAGTNYCPTSARVFWCYSAASIPVGWTRDTDFDDCYLQGTSADSRTTGGGAHTHTIAHVHTGAAHTHTMTAASTTPVYSETYSSDPSGINMSSLTHGHSSATSGSATITYQNPSQITSSGSAKPPSVRAILIYPSTADKHIPDDGVGLWDDVGGAPAGWHVTDGAGGSVNLDEKFILGAEALGDGGGAVGATTHNHTDSHTHASDSHYHDYAICGNSTSSLKVLAGSDAYYARAHHSVYLQPRDAGATNSTAATIDNATFEPAYTYMLGVQNVSGAADTPIDIILPYVGTVASIPDNWTQCDGTDGTVDLTTTQIKVSADTGDIGDTGGNNSHTHGSTTAHGHTMAAGHNHTETETDITPTAADLDATRTGPDPMKGHAHTWTIGSTTPTMSTATFTTGSSDGRYNYRTCVFIKKVSEVSTARRVMSVT